MDEMERYALEQIMARAEAGDPQAMLFFLRGIPRPEPEPVEQEPVDREEVRQDVLAMLEWLDEDGLRELQDWIADAHEFYKGDGGTPLEDIEP